MAACAAVLSLLPISAASAQTKAKAQNVPEITYDSAPNLLKFPANIYVYQHQELFPGIPPIAHLLRLPLQAVFILWAYWYTRPDRPLGAPVQPATASQR